MKDSYGEKYVARTYVVMAVKDREFNRMLREGYSPIGYINAISPDNSYMYVNFSKRKTKETVQLKVDKAVARKLRILTGVLEVKEN